VIPWGEIETLFLDAGNTLVSIDFPFVAGELAARGVDVACQLRIGSQVVLDERAGVGAGFSSQVHGQQVPHHVSRDLHGVFSIAAAERLPLLRASASFRRARCTFTLAATGEMRSAAAISL
jgi:hypothetical protein